MNEFVLEYLSVDSCNSEKYALRYLKAFSRNSKKCPSNKTEIAIGGDVLSKSWFCPVNWHLVKFGPRPGGV